MENNDYTLFTTAELQKKMMDIKNIYETVKSEIMTKLNELDSLSEEYDKCELELRKRNYL